MSNEENNYKEKDTAFYVAAVNAWFTTKFEKDKHLLSLASAGIGLLVTLATAVGVSSVCSAVMYGLAVVSFLVCILAVLSIFSRNADHMKKIIHEKEDRDPLLGFLDKTASLSFVFGIIFTLLIGLLSGIESIKIKESTMANDSEKRVRTNKSDQIKSLDGAAELRPSKPQTPSQPTQAETQSGQSEGNSNKEK